MMQDAEYARIGAFAPPPIVSPNTVNGPMVSPGQGGYRPPPADPMSDLP